MRVVFCADVIGVEYLMLVVQQWGDQYGVLILVLVPESNLNLVGREDIWNNETFIHGFAFLVTICFLFECITIRICVGEG